MSVESLAPETVATSPLGFRRQRVAADDAAPAAQLGARGVGTLPGALAAPLLAPALPAGTGVCDAWLGGADIRRHRDGALQVATDGHWLYGRIEIEAGADGVQEAARRAYEAVFGALAQGPCAELLRVWNYLPAINGESGGVERYRQFNAGRQQAFIEARRSAFDGAPAACALGTRDGPLSVAFLAARAAPLPIENPRQVSAYRYPDRYGARSPTFSRGALADAGGGRRVLFISGTASIVGHETVHAGDVRRQTAESLLNLDTVRHAAAARAGVPIAADALVYTIYLRHAADLAAVRDGFERHVGAASPAARDALYLQADVCRADLLVEIEAHGFVAAGGAA